MADHVGQQLGHYQLLQLLGKGSFAEVYLAEHAHSGTRVAIKVFNVDLADEDIDSFRAEARTISRLSHSHIVRLLDFGVEGSTPYLVMHYAQGSTLRRRLPQNIPIPPAAVLPFVEQVVSALQYAHDQGIIHRNIKPENMLLNTRAELLLSDFSITVLEQKTRFQSNQEAIAAAYMAPEQIRGQTSQATDQYALGIMVYEWLTGTRPFEGTLREVVTQHLAASPPPMHERAPHLPPALEEVILKALTKDPRGRFPTIGAFAHAFRVSAQEQMPTLNRPPAPSPTPPRRSSLFEPPTLNTPSPISPPPRSGAASMQGLPSRMRPPPDISPAGASGFSSQRASSSRDNLDFQQLESSRGGPPAIRPRLDLVPTPSPRRSSPRVLAIVTVVVVIIIVVSSLGILGATGSGPLAGLFNSTTANSPGVTPTGTANNAANGKGCTKVGVLLPDTSSSRWEAYDHPLLIQQLEANGFSSNNIDYADANGNASGQLSQAKSDLSNGDCILIVAAEDSQSAASIVAAAKQKQVPVIAYDRLIFSDELNYYVSFDGVAVGKLQGQYIADHYMDPVYGVRPGHNNIAFIDGSPTDNNATLFAQGAHQVLDPLINAGTLKNVYEKFTPNWDPPTSAQEIQEALTTTNNNIQLILSANDDMGGAIIQTLKTQGLAGKVLVTGQDATVAGLQRILENTQAMTVYKPIIKEATAAAQLAAALRDGKDVTTLTKNQTTKNPQGQANIPSVLETPIAVDRTNMAATVIADNYVTTDQLCIGLPAGTDTSGICPTS